jgi:hypothetical protein
MRVDAGELNKHVERANTALQAIQDMVGRNGTLGKIRFPTVLIRPVREHIGPYSWINKNTLNRNICYHLIFADVLRWLVNRTSLFSVAKSMVVKHVIAVHGAIAESLTVEAMKELGHGKPKFAKRLERLRDEAVIDEALMDELIWLWETRSAVHVYEVTDLELDAYDVPDGNRAIKATRALTERLQVFMDARMFDPIDQPA